MTLIGHVFSKFSSPKTVVRLMSKKSSFRGRFDRQRNKCVETLLQSKRQHFHRNDFHID